MPGFLDVGDGGIFQAWWLEPMVASASFALAIHFFWYHERQRGISRDNRLMDVMNLSGFGDLTGNLLAYWVGILIFRSLIQLEKPPDGIPENIQGVVHVCFEVISGIILYDAIFFVIHWLMHNVRCLHPFHRRHHHTPKTIEARDVLRHSLVDGTLQVLCNIFVQQKNHLGDPKSRLARLIHNIVVTWMLTESHTATPEPNLFRRCFVGVRDHRLHHLGLKAKHRESYQQFFGYLDGALEQAFRQTGDTATKK